MAKLNLKSRFLIIFYSIFALNNQLIDRGKAAIDEGLTIRHATIDGGKWRGGGTMTQMVWSSTSFVGTGVLNLLRSRCL